MHKILSVKRKSALRRAFSFSINEWLVKVEHPDGKVKQYSAWAGIDKPCAKYLLFEIRQGLGYEGYDALTRKIVGEEKVHLAVENVVVDQVTESVVLTQENQATHHITSHLSVRRGR